MGGLSLNPFTGFGLLDGGAGDILDGITGKTGADAATQAGQIQADAIVRAAEMGDQSAQRIQQMLEQQMGITRQSFAPFLQAGQTALPGIQQGATLGGIDEILNQIMGGGVFGGLVDERTRGVQGQLAAGGLMRSGRGVEEAANIGSDLALQLEGLLNSRQSNLGGMGLNAAAQQGSQGNSLTQLLTNAITGSTESGMNAITGAANATASGILGAAQSQAAGMQGMMNLGGMLGYAALSDPRLKENIRTLGKVGPLDLIEWDWIPEAKGTYVDNCPNIGFMSTQVKEHYPEHVGELGGFDVVFYGDLMEDLANGI